MMLTVQDFVTLLHKTRLNTGSTEIQFPTPPPAYGQGHDVYITAVNIRGTIFSQLIIFKELLNQVPCLCLILTEKP